MDFEEACDDDDDRVGEDSASLPDDDEDGVQSESSSLNSQQLGQEGEEDEAAADTQKK